MSFKKIGVGVRPVKRMFRVESLWGELVDLAGQQTKDLLEISYPTAEQPPGMNHYGVRNPTTGFQISCSGSDVIISQTAYPKDKGTVDADKFMDELSKAWELVDQVLRPRDIRRIGIFVEHRASDIDGPSKKILDALTKLAPAGTAHQVMINYQAMSKAGSPGEVDEKRDAYLNVGSQIYDSALDKDKSEQRALNANLDVQLHYAPPISKGIVDAIRALYRKEFSTEWRAFGERLKQFDLPL